MISENAYPAFYHRGAVLLKDLEGRIGSENLLEVLRTCIAEDVHNTEGFLQILANKAGEGEMDRFRQELSQ